MTFKGCVVTTTDSVATEKDHQLAFSLSTCLCLQADMEKHDYLTELKAIRFATKTMVFSIQKIHLAHKHVLELWKTTRAAIVDVDAKAAELKKEKAQLAKLATGKERLAELVSVAEADKQKALAEKKDCYLCKLAKIEKKKNAKIQELRKKMKDAEEQGFKEGEDTYIQ